MAERDWGWWGWWMLSFNKAGIGLAACAGSGPVAESGISELTLRAGLTYNGAMNALPYSSFLLLPGAQGDLVVLRPHLCGEG